MEELGTFGVITGIVSIITLIVFFVMAAALANISGNMRRVTKILNHLAIEKGYELKFTCPDCKTSFEGKQPTCPNCGTEFKYGK